MAERQPQHVGIRLRLFDLAAQSGCMTTFFNLSDPRQPEMWLELMSLADEGGERGARMVPQVHVRDLQSIMGFRAHLPFDRLPVWNELRALSLSVPVGMYVTSTSTDWLAMIGPCGDDESIAAENTPGLAPVNTNWKFCSSAFGSGLPDTR